METSNWMEFNQPLIEEPSSVEICRLKSGLNVSCLLKVFDYLSVDDLIQLCNTDKYFEELILKWTIKKRKISMDFGFPEGDPFSSVDAEIVQIFQKFGKSMRKLELQGYNNFSRWLEMIMEYCQPATFTEVELKIYDLDVNRNGMQVVRKSMPFFANLQKLTFCQHFHDEIYAEFLTCIATTATNLKRLKVRQAHADGKVPMKLGWLKKMKNLNELLIISDRSSVYNLDNCWGRNPKLKVFRFVGHQNITTVSDTLSKCFTGLTEFSDINLENPYNQFDAATMERYNFLSTFLHLNSVTLTSYTFCGCDLYYPLVTLAKKNINTLKVYMNYSRPIMLSEKEKNEIMQRPLPVFSYLETVEISLSEDTYQVEYELADCDLRCHFMFRFMSQLKNIQCVKFCGSFLVNLHNVLEHVPKLPILHISGRVELYAIQNIAKIRKSNNGDLLNLILNDYYSDLYAEIFYSASYSLHTEKLNELKDILNISFKGPTVSILTHKPRAHHGIECMDRNEIRKNRVKHNPDEIQEKLRKCNIS